MIIFYLIGLAMLIIGIYLWTDTYAFRAKAATIKGEIFGYNREEHNRGYVYYPIVKYHHGGEEYSFQSALGRNSREYMIGQDVDVLVIGNDHSQARLKQMARPIISSVISVMGLLFSTIYLATAFDVILLLVPVILIPAGVVILRKLNPLPTQNNSNHAVESYQRKKWKIFPSRETNDLIRENATYDETASKDAYIWMHVIGAVTLVVSLYWLQDINSLVDVSVRTDGTIVAQQSAFDKGERTYAPVVSFHTDAHGAVRFNGTTYSRHPSWHIGDHVTVLYDPKKPHRAMIDGGFNFGGPLALGLFSIFAFAIGRYLYRRKVRFEKASA
ncbi:DUF3592 domain-containing protein [Sulfurimonas sp. HSL-1656]|uniref:DUF3592 domain-containing protein n=1 Tax=Thiomicrolovo subterrani TaxID=3131934 RepID=UPI0031F7D6FD